MLSRTVLITSLTGLCMVGAGKATSVEAALDALACGDESENAPGTSNPYEDSMEVVVQVLRALRNSGHLICDEDAEQRLLDALCQTTLFWLDYQRVAGDQLQLVAEALPQHRRQPAVLLDRDQLAERRKPLGQDAAAGADFEDALARSDFGGSDDAVGDVVVHQEMLPQRLAAAGGRMRHLALNTEADKNTPATTAFSYIPASGRPCGPVV